MFGSDVLFAGGGTPTVQDVIDYTTISTAQDAVDFGKWDNAFNRVKFCGRYYQQSADFTVTVDIY